MTVSFWVGQGGLRRTPVLPRGGERTDSAHVYERGSYGEQLGRSTVGAGPLLLSNTPYRANGTTMVSAHLYNDGVNACLLQPPGPDCQATNPGPAETLAGAGAHVVMRPHDRGDGGGTLVDSPMLRVYDIGGQNNLGVQTPSPIGSSLSAGTPGHLVLSKSNTPSSSYATPLMIAAPATGGQTKCALTGRSIVSPSNSDAALPAINYRDPSTTASKRSAASSVVKRRLSLDAFASPTSQVGSMKPDPPGMSPDLVGRMKQQLQAASEQKAAALSPRMAELERKLERKFDDASKRLDDLEKQKEQLQQQKESIRQQEKRINGLASTNLEAFARIDAHSKSLISLRQQQQAQQEQIYVHDRTLRKQAITIAGQSKELATLSTRVAVVEACQTKIVATLNALEAQLHDVQAEIVGTKAELATKVRDFLGELIAEVSDNGNTAVFFDRPVLTKITHVFNAKFQSKPFGKGRNGDRTGVQLNEVEDIYDQYHNPQIKRGPFSPGELAIVSAALERRVGPKDIGKKVLPQNGRPPRGKVQMGIQVRKMRDQKKKAAAALSQFVPTMPPCRFSK